MGKKPSDKARQYCTTIGVKNNRLRCKFCGHIMSGITRFKEHLAKKGGDVIECTENCPKEVTREMIEELIQLSLKREEKERKAREALQRNMTNAPPPPLNAQDRPAAAAPPPPSNAQERPANAAEAAAPADLESEERALMEKVMKESLRTFEKEKKKAEKYDNDETEAAIPESMRSYREEKWRRGEGCSKYARAGPSSFGNNESFGVDPDYDSDFNF